MVGGGQWPPPVKSFLFWGVSHGCPCREPVANFTWKRLTAHSATELIKYTDLYSNTLITNAYIVRLCIFFFYSLYHCLHVSACSVFLHHEKLQVLCSLWLRQVDESMKVMKCSVSSFSLIIFSHGDGFGVPVGWCAPSRETHKRTWKRAWCIYSKLKPASTWERQR